MQSAEKCKKSELKGNAKITEDFPALLRPALPPAAPSPLPSEAAVWTS